jgi:Neuraminidase (sialidase)
MPGYVYATWDRLEQNGHGPAYFTRSLDGGITWEAARAIHDPGNRNQTLNNQIVAVASGGGEVLVDFFTEFDTGQDNVVTAHLALVRSTDQGATWSAPIVVSDLRAVGTADPQNSARTLRDAANLGAFASGRDGTLVAVWQDSRFSAGARDGIAFAVSLDAGSTWSTPVLINAVPGVQALLPAVSIAADGTIGVLYYDMRNDTADPATLLVDVWLTTTTDRGVTWREHHVTGPFDFNLAPIAEGGLFVGDYQGLVSGGLGFTALFARTGTGLADRTSVFASTVLAPGVGLKSVYRAHEASAVVTTPAWQSRLDESARRTLRQRLHGAAPPAPSVLPGR